MRTFVAIELHPDLQRRLGGLIDDLRRGGADVRWVATANLHLTLAFLGEVDPALLPALEDSLRAVARRHAPFTLGAREVGSFPARGQPRVLWVGLEASEALACLQREVAEGLRALGLPLEDRAFSPHLTVGRVRSPRGWPALRARLETWREREFGRQGVEEFVLLESQLRPPGPRYRPLARFPLGSN